MQNARAVAQLLYHLHVVGGAFEQALRLQLLALGVQFLHARAQVELYLRHRRRLAGGRCHEDVGGIDFEAVVAAEGDVVVGVVGLYGLYLVAPEDNAQHYVLVGQADVDCVALDAERATAQVHLVARVERGHEFAQKGVARHFLPHLHVDDVLVEILGVADAVEARHARHHHHVAAAAEQGRGGGQAQAVEFLVDGEVFFYVFVGRGDVGLRLVVVVVADEVLHGVLGEELLELGVELCGQRLVVAEDERGLLHALYHVGHGEGLARTRHAEQRLGVGSGSDGARQLVDGLRLVARGLVLRMKLEIHNLQRY